MQMYQQSIYVRNKLKSNHVETTVLLCLETSSERLDVSVVDKGGLINIAGHCAHCESRVPLLDHVPRYPPAS